MLTLLGQATLAMTSMGIVVLYVCLGIGMGRALRSLQDRAELQVIHVSMLAGSLMRAVLIFGTAGGALLLVLTHFIDPLSARATNNWSASIAADLVSRSMVPHRFTEVVDGVSFIIGSRDAEGQIDVAAATQRITDIVEGWVREHPDQWLWLHRRWR